jgi:peptidoglycan/xylan/chitin deacetylase (PgdA/CDA1 family)
MQVLTPGSRARRHVRGMVAGGLHAAQRLWRAGRPRQEARVLYYHRIDDEPHRSCVTPQAFREQMQYLRDHGYRVVALDDIATALTRGLPFPPNTIAVTFDDGFADNYERAFPVLAALGLPATIFVTVDAVGGRLTVLRDRPDGVPALTWEQIRAMLRAGGMAIGSHTRTHRELTALPAAAVRDELVQSREIIAAETGVVPDLFCYPRGAANAAVHAAVRAAGYRLACGTRAGGVTPHSDPLSVARTFVARDDGLMDFARKLDGAFDYLHHGVALLRRHLPAAALG